MFSGLPGYSAANTDPNLPYQPIPNTLIHSCKVLAVCLFQNLKAYTNQCADPLLLKPSPRQSIANTVIQ